MPNLPAQLCYIPLSLYVRGRRAAELVAMQYAVLSSYMHVS